MKRILLMAVAVITGIAAGAQSPTTVTTVTTCRTFANFNATNEGFSSPSIYSDANDVAFNWTGTEQVESSGLTVRTASLISPIYIQSVQGSATVGFRYSAPMGTEYRIRIITALGISPQEVVANTANGPVYTPLPGTSGNICVQLDDADIELGRQIRVEFTFRSNQPGNIVFDDLSVAAATSPLPVTFEGFIGRNDPDGSLKLLWNVAREINVRGYYVESSINGQNFNELGYVTASGKSVYTLNYPGRLVQTIYFRVRSIDINGAVKYTPVIKIYVPGQSSSAMAIYPNPATDLATIQHPPSPNKGLITVTGADGTKHLQQVAVPNSLQTQVHVANLPSGIYIVTFNDGVRAQSTRLVKQ